MCCKLQFIVLMYCTNVHDHTCYRMTTISLTVNVSHVIVILLAPIIIFVIRPVASVVACQTLRVEGAICHSQGFSSGHLTTSGLKQKTFPIQRYHMVCVEELHCHLHHNRNLCKCFLSQVIQCMRIPSLGEALLPILTPLEN